MTKKAKSIVVVLVFVVFAAVCLGPTSDPWDGSGWDVTAPDIDQPHGNTYLELQDLRKGIAIRMNKEHATLAASSAGGEHKNGSAVCYEDVNEPSDRPDGATALADNVYDRGRLWLDDNYDPPVLKRWDGSAWEVVGTIAAGATPQAFMHNTTHEDTERGRESQIRAYGEQSGGEQSTLGYIEISHDGTSDDQKGRYVVVLNDGDDDDAPSVIPIVWTSAGIDVADSDAVLDEDNMSSNDAARLATQQSIKTYADTKLAKDGSVAFTGTGAGFKDEDDLSSNSATAAASQQSIKAYVATQIAAIQDPTYSGGESHTFDGGLILKMGYKADAGATTTITFGSAFPHAIVSATLTEKHAGATATAIFTSISTTQLVIHDGGTYDGYCWTAIGY